MPLGVPTQTVLNGGVNRSGGRTRQTSRGTAPSGSTTPFTPTAEYAGAPMPTNLSWDQAQQLAQLPPNQREPFLRSGVEFDVWQKLGPASQRVTSQWGTNLAQAPQIIQQQRQVYDGNVAQRTANNQYIDQYGALQTSMQDNLLNQYTQGAGMASARYDLGFDQLEQGYHTDRALLDERRYRDVDLARNNNAVDLNYQNVMRGVLDERRGIRGEVFGIQQDYLNDQLGFVNRSQDNAYNRFQSSDAYLGQQGKDLMAQYGFNARGFDQDIQSAFAQRGTQQRGAVSDAAARGAFGSAGFGDNIQDIYGQYQRATDAATLQLDQGNQAVDERGRAIGNDRANLRFNYTDQTIGFDRDKRGIDKGHQDNITGYRDDLATFRGQYAANDRDRAQLQNVNKGLDSLAREYGIKATDLRNQFDNAVTKMGLDLNDTMGQLEQMLNSGNAQLQAQGMQFMQQMMAFQ